MNFESFGVTSEYLIRFNKTQVKARVFNEQLNEYSASRLEIYMDRPSYKTIKENRIGFGTFFFIFNSYVVALTGKPWVLFKS